MQHGRDHEHRQTHIRRSRANNTPEVDPITQSEQDMIEGQSPIAPRAGRVGAQAFQGRHSTVSAHDANPKQRTGSGSDVAPTKQAEEREQERHRLERKLGRIPAGEAGLARDHRTPEVTHAALDAAAREADRRVVGHEISSPSKALGANQSTGRVADKKEN